MTQLTNLDLGPVSRGAASSPAPSGHGLVARPGTLPLGPLGEARDPETVARTLYAQLRDSGYSEQQVIALAGELLSLVTADVRSQTKG